MSTDHCLERLREVRHLALDMDGTIYRGGTLFEFTPPFLAQMSELGIGVSFLTNNSSKSARDYLHHLQRFGLDARADQLFTSGQATIAYLQTHLPHYRRLFVLGTVSLQTEFSEHGLEVVGTTAAQEPDAVVVGFDTGLCFERLCLAGYWISQGKPFVATHPDRICPTDQQTLLVDCGAICACLEHATGRAPDLVLGKPHPCMLEGILLRHGLQQHQLAMVGDRLTTDLAMARVSGALGVLVLTGEATRDDAENCVPPPDLVVTDLAELGRLLVSSKS